MEKLMTMPFTVHAPRYSDTDSDQLFVHVLEWLTNDMERDPPDVSGFPVGWVEVWRNPRHGWHIYSSEPHLPSFRRPGDDRSYRARIDAWKIVGDVPGGRASTVFVGSSEVDCGSAVGGS